MKHLVIIGLVIPEPASTAAGFRMLQIINLFKDWGYKISFLTSAQNVEFSEKMAVQKIELNDESFDDLIKTLNPNVVLFDRFLTEEQFGWRVAEQCPNALKLLDTEDLHFLREARKKAYKENKTVFESDLLNDVFKRELASILRCDLSLIISEFEMDLLTKNFKISPKILFYLPFLTEVTHPINPNFEERKDFLSIGNFLHEPNWETVLLLKQYWKTIKKQLPETELHIYGAYVNEKVLKLHNQTDGFLVKGRAITSEDVFKKYKVLLAPIPFGAGLKGKLWESMLFGIPNVTTKIGAEGMQGTFGWNGFIEDLPENFCKKAVELYQNKTLWNEATDNGYLILEKRFDKKLFANKLKNKILKLSKDLQNHRNLNFMGQILNHHLLTSTKYLSKWIEEKNKSRD